MLNKIISHLVKEFTREHNMQESVIQTDKLYNSYFSNEYEIITKRGEIKCVKNYNYMK